MWSKIKQILRSVKARTQEALLAAIVAALECVSEKEVLLGFAYLQMPDGG
jgi:ribosomal protein L12E/L44/L45/RPP1/RPP2